MYDARHADEIEAGSPAKLLINLSTVAARLCREVVDLMMNDLVSRLVPRN